MVIWGGLTWQDNKSKLAKQESKKKNNKSRVKTIFFSLEQSQSERNLVKIPKPAAETSAAHLRFVQGEKDLRRG